MNGSGSTCTRRYSRAGAGRRPSRGRSWRVTPRPGSRSSELAKELDAGPIAAQRVVRDRVGTTTPVRVFAKAAGVATDLLEVVLADPAPEFRVQRGEATYAEKISPADRRLDLSRPSHELVNVVRALSPHIGARAEFHGRSLTIWRARTGDDGSFTPVDVQPDGGRRMSYDAWLRGLRR